MATTASPQQKIAIRRLVQDASGNLRVILVDAYTYKPVTDQTGYQVVDIGDVPEQVQNVSQPDAAAPVKDKTNTQKVTQGDTRGGNETGVRTNQGPTRNIGTRSFPSAPSSPAPSTPTSSKVTASPSVASLGGPPAKSVDSLGSPVGSAGAAPSIGNGGITYSMGPNRPNRPDASITNAIQNAAAQTLGPGYGVNVVSGTEDAGQQYGSNRHSTKEAADVGFTSPSGQKVTDANALGRVADQFAYNNPADASIGYGQGYMGPGLMHLDLAHAVNPSIAATEWGAGDSISPKGTIRNMDPGLVGSINQARQAGLETQQAVQQGFAATPGFFTSAVPSARPDATPGSLVSQDERGSLATRLGLDSSPLSTSVAQNTIDSAKSTQSVSERSQATGTVPDSATSPAAMAARGMVTRTPAELDSIAKTISGELGPQTLANLNSPDPAAQADARAQLANIQTTIENRAATTEFGTIADTLAPSQYASLAPSNLGVTNNNYSKFGPQVLSAVKDFYTGLNPPTNYAFTNYANTQAIPGKYTPPGWLGNIQDPTMVGPFTFGVDPALGPDAASRTAAQSFQTMTGTSYQPGKMQDDNVNSWGGSPNDAAQNGAYGADHGYGWGGSNTSVGGRYGGNNDSSQNGSYGADHGYGWGGGGSSNAGGIGGGGGYSSSSGNGNGRGSSGAGYGGPGDSGSGGGGYSSSSGNGNGRGSSGAGYGGGGGNGAGSDSSGWGGNGSSTDSGGSRSNGNGGWGGL